MKTLRGWRSFIGYVLALVVFAILSGMYISILSSSPEKINENVFAFVAGGITAIVGVFFASNAVKSIGYQKYNQTKKDEPNN